MPFRVAFFEDFFAVLLAAFFVVFFAAFLVVFFAVLFAAFRVVFFDAFFDAFFAVFLEAFFEDFFAVFEDFFAVFFTADFRDAFLGAAALDEPPPDRLPAAREPPAGRAAMSFMSSSRLDPFPPGIVVYMEGAGACGVGSFDNALSSIQPLCQPDSISSCTDIGAPLNAYAARPAVG